MFCPECDRELPDSRLLGRKSILCSIRDGGCGELIIPVEYSSEGGAIAEIEVPDCFKFYEVRDKVCSRCSVKEMCKDAFLARRQPCHGRYSQETVECMYCQLSSQCADDTINKEKNLMPKKVTIRKPPQRQVPGNSPKLPPRRVAAPVVEEPVQEEEEVLETADADYGSMGMLDLRDLCKELELPDTGRKSVLVRRLMAYDQGEVEPTEDDDSEEEQEEPVAEVKAPARRAVPGKPQRPMPMKPVASKPAAVVDLDEDLDEGVDDNPIMALVDALEAGMSINISKNADGSWTVGKASIGAPVAQPQSGKRRGMAMTGADFEKEAFSPEFYEYVYEDAAGSGKGWTTLTPEERYTVAAELGAEWVQHEEPKTDAMRMGQAVREILGIPKWKPQYESTAARRALREEGIVLS